MKRTQRTFVLALAAIATAAFAAQDGMVLRHTLKENSTDTYKLESKAVQTADIPGVGEQTSNITTNSTYVLKTNTIDGTSGLANVALTRTVDSIDADGQYGEMVKNNIPKPSTTPGTLSAAGVFKVDTSKLTGTQAMTMGQEAANNPVILQFTDKAVKIGDTWNIVIPKGPTSYSEDQTITAKLTGEKKVGDKDVWVVTTTGTIKIDLDTAKFAEDPNESGPMAGMKVHITGPTEITGETLVEKSTGRTIRAEIKTKSNQKIEISAVGMSIDSKTVGTTIVTLKE